MAIYIMPRTTTIEFHILLETMSFVYNRITVSFSSLYTEIFFMFYNLRSLNSFCIFIRFLIIAFILSTISSEVMFCGALDKRAYLMIFFLISH